MINKIQKKHSTYCHVFIVFLILSCSGNCYSEISDKIKTQVSNSLEKMDSAVMAQEWFYTMTTRQNNEIIISKNNPEKVPANRLELISIDGNPPSKKRVEKFYKEQKERASPDGNQEPKFSELIDITTLKLVAQNPVTTIVSFVPIIEELKKERDKFSGLLSLSNETKLIDEITIVNIDKVKPAFSVTLNTYKTQLNFIDIDDTLLMNHMSMTIEGKVGFFKKIDIDMAIDFANFYRQSNPQLSNISNK